MRGVARLGGMRGAALSCARTSLRKRRRAARGGAARRQGRCGAVAAAATSAQRKRAHTPLPHAPGRATAARCCARSAVCSCCTPRCGRLRLRRARRAPRVTSARHAAVPFSCADATSPERDARRLRRREPVRRRAADARAQQPQCRAERVAMVVQRRAGAAYGAWAKLFMPATRFVRCAAIFLRSRPQSGPGIGRTVCSLGASLRLIQPHLGLEAPGKPRSSCPSPTAARFSHRLESAAWLSHISSRAVVQRRKRSRRHPPREVFGLNS